MELFFFLGPEYTVPKLLSAALMLSRLTSLHVQCQGLPPWPSSRSACSLRTPVLPSSSARGSVALLQAGDPLPGPGPFSPSSWLWDSAPSAPLPPSTSSAFPFSWPFLSSCEYALVISTHKNSRTNQQTMQTSSALHSSPATTGSFSSLSHPAFPERPILTDPRPPHAQKVLSLTFGTIDYLMVASSGLCPDLTPPNLFAGLTVLLTLYPPGFSSTYSPGSWTVLAPGIICPGILSWPGLLTDDRPSSSLRPAAFWMPSPGCPQTSLSKPELSVSLGPSPPPVNSALSSRSPRQKPDSV